MKSWTICVKQPFLAGAWILAGLVITGGCSQLSAEDSPLDPDQPVSVTLWHYYSGQTKEIFDELVSDFNDSVGVEKGIVVDARSQGDVRQLEEAVYDAANERMGAQQMPDLFMTYPDNAYRIDALGKLADLNTYFSDGELEAFRDEFLDEGYVNEEGDLHIMPIAKSSENLYLNQTFFEPFSEETGYTHEDLATWEGVLEVAEAYYDWSGGEAFMGIDSDPNFMLVTAMQQGSELFDYSDSPVTLNMDEEKARHIWTNYYEPYIRGHFAKTGRFSSDDAKVGVTIAYTGSTAGAVYFPMDVTLSQDDTREIEVETLPYPYMAAGEKVAVQQGAGMSVAKSTTEHEYASSVFLKWLTDPEQNVPFAVSTGYFPVKDEALEESVLMAALEERGDDLHPAVPSTVATTAGMFEDYDLYFYRPFPGSAEMRHLLENHLFSRIERNVAMLQDDDLSEDEREAMIADLIADEAFHEWYESFLESAEAHMPKD